MVPAPLLPASEPVANGVANGGDSHHRDGHHTTSPPAAALGKPPLPFKDRAIEGLQRGGSKAIALLRRSSSDNLLATADGATGTTTGDGTDHALSNGHGTGTTTKPAQATTPPPPPPAPDHAADSQSDDSDEEEEDWSYPEDRLRHADRSYGIDERDLGTADAWVRRHPDLVRLTGRHPFNCEPPLTKLMEAGFLTPVPLHYVRNHGHVPHCAPGDGDAWTVSVQGRAFTVAQIKAEFKARAVPVTLVCAGNRRKEENMVKQTIGFNWGAAGVSTSVWRGARLCDVLRRVGVKPRRNGARYVCFEGAETLPGGGGGGTKYGTSLKIDVAMNEANDILLAYEQNGRALEPDHGFPIRIIIPGHIGGRMVKWLTKIWVSPLESDNYYHYKDNRVLPQHVDAHTATADGWWYRPEYIINELNINSAISSPAHGEILPINFATVAAPYLIKGYAYSGGGRKVVTVEVSLDEGKSWRYATLTRPERPTRYGKHWCWCFWEVGVEVMELLSAKEVLVRAWDEAMNSQPQSITWNVMGMMNNCWFRVRVHPCKPKQGGLGLTFEHPTRPGNQTGGWMEELQPKQAAAAAEGTAKKKLGGLSKSVSTPFLTEHKRIITPSELRKHATPDAPWIVVHNKVYDCTKFLDDHPGGRDSILINAGTDCTEEFDAIHSSRAKDMLEDYYIGDLAVVAGSLSVDATPDPSLRGANTALLATAAAASPSAAATLLAAAAAAAPAAAPPPSTTTPPLVALNPRERIPFRLAERHQLSHDVLRLRFALQTPNHVLGLPVGKHIFLSATINGKLLLRAYTPTTADADGPGFFDLVVKIYPPLPPRFPVGGLMSQHLASLAVGDTVDVKGPLGHLHYLGRGEFTANGKPRRARRIALLAGGTGITPVYQIAKAVLRDESDGTELAVIYANRTVEDILLREDLDAWQREHPGRFRVWYTVQEAPRSEDWKYDVGFMTEAMFRTHLFPAAEDTVAFMCGPPPMLEFCCHPFLANMGYDKANCFVF